MNDGFWHKAWQFALLFAVIVLLGVSVFIQNQAASDDDVRAILAEEGVSGFGGVLGDVSIRPELTRSPTS